MTTAEDKEATAAVATDRATIEKQQAEDSENARLAATARSASQTESIAFNELHEQIVARVAQELRDEANGQKSKSFGGQHVTSDNFSAATTESYGTPRVEIKPSGWVGDGFVVTGARIKELIKLLGTLKNLPEQE